MHGRISLDYYAKSLRSRMKRRIRRTGEAYSTGVSLLQLAQLSANEAKAEYCFAQER